MLLVIYLWARIRRSVTLLNVMRDSSDELSIYIPTEDLALKSERPVYGVAVVHME